MKLILLTTILVSCGPSNSVDWPETPLDKEPPYVEREEPIEELNLIVNSFLNDCEAKYGADTSLISKLEFVRYGDPSTDENRNIVGVCNIYTVNGKIVRTNIIMQDMGDHLLNKALLYHELGHCVLNLDHTEQDPQTIMSPYISNSKFYKSNWDELVENMCLGYSK